MITTTLGVNRGGLFSNNCRFAVADIPSLLRIDSDIAWRVIFGDL